MSGLCFSGSAWRLGDDIDTDAILPARYLSLTDEKQLGARFMEDVKPGFAERIAQGDILVAGENFGCGSSREHAPIAIKGCGFSCVVAVSFSRLFFRNAVNIGLPVLVSEQARLIEEGDGVKVDCLKGLITVTDTSNGREFSGVPISDFMREILVAGGLIPYLKNRMR